MTSTAPTAHITFQHRTLAPATITNPRRETFGWSCSAEGCPVRTAGYGDQGASLKDAADHEQRQSMALFTPGTLVVPVGPGGSGKSRFAAMFPSSWVVCLDELRERISGDAGDQSATREAVALQDLLIPARLTRGLTTVVDSTNVEARVRRGLVDKARQHGRPVAAIVFLTDLDTCEARNARRSANRRVPLPVLRRQHEQTLAALPLLVDEGFTDVRTVGNHRP
ncbi:AAA family ATPase [Streptomyces sp. ISL-36]|uniref:AAA family ATPase n=1 Tax=Streptomyces sp. ISL-36 TaxID=2819182 RepID=UPI001BE61635|nr:AAA family ATPase [Streptomyces sp. ISL-36]MBT2439823.1 AAA family ATPase [Streptomyces sp. ISL-36]